MKGVICTVTNLIAAANSGDKRATLIALRDILAKTKVSKHDRLKRKNDAR